MKLGLISEGTNTWPLYVAQARKLFEAEGLTVEVTVTGSSVEQQRRLIGGDFDIGFQQADHVVRAVEQGSDLFIFMPLGHAPDLTLVAAGNIKTIRDLRGHAVAVDGARTGYALLLRRLLSSHRLTEAEVTFREVGGSRERYDAMLRGHVTAALLNAPFDAQLVAEGYTALARMNEEFPAYPGPVMAARRSWASAHQKDLVGFIRAFGAGYAWLADPSHAPEALRMLPAHLDTPDAVARRALQEFASRSRPRLAREGIEQVIQTYWSAERLGGPSPSPDKYMDLAYMERALG